MLNKSENKGLTSSILLWPENSPDKSEKFNCYLFCRRCYQRHISFSQTFNCTKFQFEHEIFNRPSEYCSITVEIAVYSNVNKSIIWWHNFQINFPAIFLYEIHWRTYVYLLMVALMHQQQNFTNKQANKLEYHQEPEPQFKRTFPQIKYLDEITHTKRISTFSNIK